MARKSITKRTGERLVRLAYDLEYLANALKAEGHSEADTVRVASQSCGYAGRSLLDRIGA